MEVAMSLYSSKLVGVVMMADETRTSYMTQREGDKGTRLREIPPQMSHMPTPWRSKDPGSQGNLGSPSTPDHEGKP
eukprot:Em0003g1246a